MVTLASATVAFAKEVTVDVEYITIKKFGFVADTFNGVAAKYNPWGTNYDCAELVYRYYREYYGIALTLSGNRPNVVGDETHYFEEVKDPQPGDIFFATARRRGRPYDHWAICKEVDAEANTITMFEQNWRWGGTAGIGRQIPYDDNCYTYFRLCHESGTVKTRAEKEEERACEQAIAAMQETLKEQLATEEAQLQQDAALEAYHKELLAKAVEEKKHETDGLREKFRSQASAAAGAAK
jgi:hypothetical protein